MLQHFRNPYLDTDRVKVLQCVALSNDMEADGHY